MHVTMSMKMKNEGFADQCPNSSGVSNGTAEHEMAQSFDIAGLPLGARVVAGYDLDAALSLSLEGNQLERE